MQRKFRLHGISRNVAALALVSFFADVASEMLYPVIPLFLTATLGASPALLGLIEGTAEGVSSGLRWIGGVLSDRSGRRKPFVVVGYALAAASKLFMGAAAYALGWPLFLLGRGCDRLGKAVRSAPRDALIADSTEAAVRGRAFGFHRAMDSLGAVIGPLLALGVLFLWPHLPLAFQFSHRRRSRALERDRGRDRRSRSHGNSAPVKRRRHKHFVWDAPAPASGVLAAPGRVWDLLLGREYDFIPSPPRDGTRPLIHSGHVCIYRLQPRLRAGFTSTGPPFGSRRAQEGCCDWLVVPCAFIRRFGGDALDDDHLGAHAALRSLHGIDGWRYEGDGRGFGSVASARRRARLVCHRRRTGTACRKCDRRSVLGVAAWRGNCSGALCDRCRISDSRDSDPWHGTNARLNSHLV